jgi:hypothetical protein
MAYEESPAANLNKGYAKQEKSDLMNDNPVARDASGGRPWISRHFRSSMGSPVKQYEDKGSMAKMDDLSGDGKVTQKDVLIGKGVLDEDGSPVKAKSIKGTKHNHSLMDAEPRHKHMKSAHSDVYSRMTPQSEDSNKAMKRSQQ